MAPKPQVLHVISATHWDREWMLSFMSYRRHLVHYTDRLLDLMREDPAFVHYHMDGQSICVEDYLRLRPERREELAGLVRAGRLLIGPWYSLPDMPLVAGEAVVRNLLVGTRLCRDLGGVMLEGYTATSNGQIAQLPQVYAGFGIHSAVIYKGIAGARTPKEFRWKSPDGSEILGIHLAARYGRTNFYCLLYQEVVAGVIHDKDPDRWPCEISDDRLPMRVDGVQYHDPYVYSALKRDEGWHPEHLAEYLGKIVAQTATGAATRHLLGFHGMDHTPPFPATPRLIAAANALRPDLEVRDSSLPEALAALRAELDFGRLVVHTGELRDPKVVKEDRDIYWPTLSATLPIKVANRCTEHRLVDRAEPLATWAWAAGADYPTVFLEDAWKLLLANQAHDSIDGCSLNKVAADIMCRFTDCQAIAEGVVEDAVASLLRRAGEDASAPVGPRLAVFNPGLHAWTGLLEADVDLPPDWSADALALRLGDGREIRPDSRDLGPCSSAVMDLVGRPLAVRRVHLRWEMDVPAMTRLDLAVVPAAAPAAAAAAPAIARPGFVLENGLLRATVREDGRVDLLHKATGRTFAGLHGLVDVGDTGDPWHHVPAGAPVREAGLLSRRVVEEGSWRAAIEVAWRLVLPAARPASAPGGVRETAEVLLFTRYSLSRSGACLEVETVVDNRCRDHRLRAVFPTGFSAPDSYAGGQFNVDERPVAKPDMNGWIEPVDGHPHHGFAGLSDGKAGLAVLDLGLPEHDFAGEGGSEIHLTLLRATQLKAWPEGAGDELSDGAQVLGRQRLRYAVLPHAGGWAGADVPGAYRRFACPPVLAPYFGKPRKASAPPLLALDHPLAQVSCLKRAESGEGLVLRLWNPGGKALETGLALGLDATAVRVLRLDETPAPGDAGLATLEGPRRARLRLPPHRILTVQVAFNHPAGS